ncbi:protein abscisic acid-insensitive 5 [Tanacetum coccineum]
MQSDSTPILGTICIDALIATNSVAEYFHIFTTLDEFQHTLTESGKNFGSMNMDEFLNSIWTAEENQAHAQVHPPPAATNTATSAAMPSNGGAASGQFLMDHTSTTSRTEMGGERGPRQLSLPRQGSITLPGPLSRKTVDEVWSEIQKTQHDQQPPSTNTNSSNDQIPAQRQPTYGEMTLEDFLVMGRRLDWVPHRRASSSMNCYKSADSGKSVLGQDKAYNVELEAELTCVKRGKMQQPTSMSGIMERKRKQQVFEEMRMKSMPKSQKVKEKPRGLRRTSSGAAFFRFIQKQRNQSTLATQDRDVSYGAFVGGMYSRTTCKIPGCLCLDLV